VVSALIDVDTARIFDYSRHMYSGFIVFRIAGTFVSLLPIGQHNYYKTFLESIDDIELNANSNKFNPISYYEQLHL